MPECPVPPTFVVSTVLPINTNVGSADCVDYTGTSPTAFCLVAAASVTVEIGGRLVGSGSRPLIVLATNTMTISGSVDVSSKRTGQSGAGSNSLSCMSGELPTQRAGGPGGTFGSPGGVGGAGNGGSASPAAVTAVTTLRGGCSGREGNGTGAGLGGRGGGAVALIAGSAITVTGAVNASGRSGDGGGLNVGGGGGGSGGMILLDAPVIGVTGTVFANGGGGGEGGGGQNQGNDGADPLVATSPARGGAGAASSGGDAGDGAAAGVPARNGGSADVGSGGGGGGGGAGVIRVAPP